MKQVINIIRSRRIIYAGIILALITAATIATAHTVQKSRANAIYKTTIASLVNHIDLSPSLKASEKFDKVRSFIHSNSMHNMDAEFYANWRDRQKMASQVLAHAEGKMDYLPHMECSTRATLMRDILEDLGYDTRSVAVHSARQQLASHTFLDAYNPETQKWESQDPDYNIHWINRETKKRTSFARVMTLEDQYLPCENNICDWSQETEVGKRASVLKSYLSFVTIIDKKRDERLTIYHNSLKPNATYTFNGVTGTFCKTQEKNCKNGFIPASSYRAATNLE